MNSKIITTNDLHDPQMRYPITKGRIMFNDVSVSYNSRGTDTLAVQETNLDIQPGEFICLLGPSGCGKSTLLNSIAGFVQPTTGEITVDDIQVLEPGPDRGMVFQQYSLFPWKTVLENIAFGPKITGRGDGTPLSTASTFLNMIGLSRYANYYPNELSGGMQQRVGIARALANYPTVLLMDEPFGALDSQTRLTMQENLLTLWKQFGITVVFVTHDVDEAVFLADRILVMSANPGRIICDLAVDLNRPRTAATTTTSNFVELRKQCLDLIRSESIKAFEQQNQ